MVWKFVIAPPLAVAMALCAPGSSGTAHAAQYTQMFDTASTPLIRLVRDGDRPGGIPPIIRGGDGGGRPKDGAGANGPFPGKPWVGGDGGGKLKSGSGANGPLPGKPWVGGDGGGKLKNGSSANGPFPGKPWVGGDGGGKPKDGPGGNGPFPGKPPGDWKPGDGKHHDKHHNARRFGRHFYWGPGYDYYYYGGYYYGNCEWLKEQAVYTDSLYWWHRYEQCRSTDW